MNHAEEGPSPATPTSSSEGTARSRVWMRGTITTRYGASASTMASGRSRCGAACRAGSRLAASLASRAAAARAKPAPRMRRPSSSARASSTGSRSLASRLNSSRTASLSRRTLRAARTSRDRAGLAACSEPGRTRRSRSGASLITDEESGATPPSTVSTAMSARGRKPRHSVACSRIPRRARLSLGLSRTHAYSRSISRSSATKSCSCGSSPMPKLSSTSGVGGGERLTAESGCISGWQNGKHERKIRDGLTSAAPHSTVGSSQKRFRASGPTRDGFRLM
mmetsp:Transcript_35876/g.115384  ORF Transcript_35876/g.115384 Transcript_35876/m.115384 type:complete len:280 (+) Transcript_35876:389-1228(+)